MNAVPNLPLPTEQPPAGTGVGARNAKPTEPVAESETIDFKSTLQEADSQERPDQNVNASSVRIKPKPPEEIILDVGGEGEPPTETVTEVAGTPVPESERPRPCAVIGHVAHMAPSVNYSTPAKPSETGTGAAPTNQSRLHGKVLPLTASEPGTRPWSSATAPTATAPDVANGTPASQDEPVQLPNMDRAAFSRETVSPSRPDAVHGRMASAERQHLTEVLPAVKSTAGDSTPPARAANPTKTVMDGVPGAARQPSAATVQAGAGDKAAPVEPEVRVHTDGPGVEAEPSDAGVLRSISKETTTAVQRAVQSSRPDFDQRTEGVNAIDRGAGPALEKTTQASAVPKSPPPSPESFRENNLSSVVERIAVTVRGSQSEARIALKPDHLGSLRVQISTDNNVVSIKIMTEFSMARDLLESHLPQLKAELQQQGLDVEEFDVSFDEEKQHFRHENRQARGSRRGGQRAGQSVEEDERAEDGLWPETRRAPVARAAGIDYFA